MLGIPSILTNTFVGIRQVDRATVDAARGIGMTEFEILRKVELPLAVRGIMTGIRGSTVNIVATATIAPLIGVVTLGDYILGENIYGADGVLAGAIVLRDPRPDLRVRPGRAAKASHLEGPAPAGRSNPLVRSNTHKEAPPVRFNNHRPLMALAMLIAALSLAVGISACGGGSSSSSRRKPPKRNRRKNDRPGRNRRRTGGRNEEEGGGGEAIKSDPANGKVSLTIGSKNFPEQEILGEIYTQALAAAGYKAKSDLSLGSETVALKTLKAGQISGYPEYASTALTSFFGLEPEEVPSDADRSVGKS